jgi:ssDNA-binding Zn-finger/Zn-ribbon topoisomerase 1
MKEIINNYPVGMHPPIKAYKYPENKDKWLHCPKCGFQPRIWEFDNGRSTFCGCSNSTYDHFSVTAKPIMEVVRENNGDATKHDSDELRKNWNKYCKNNNLIK